MSTITRLLLRVRGIDPDEIDDLLKTSKDERERMQREREQAEREARRRYVEVRYQARGGR